jgi:secreted PhoX family phosphatase
VVCMTDAVPLETPVADAEGKIAFTTVANRFVEGDADFNSFDNLDFQPQTGNLYVIEDHPNGDVFACLPDGADRDIKTDGCVKVLSVKDTSAEPTGFVFDATGTVAYVSIQHSDDKSMAKVDDYGTDDLIKVTGFKLPATN